MAPCTSRSFAFTAVDHRQRVLAEPHHDDAADDLASAVQLGDAAPDVRPEPDAGHVADADRRAARVRAERDLLDVRDGLQIAAAAHHVLAPGELEQPPFDVVVAGPDGVDDVLHAEVVGRQARRIEVDLVLLDEPADAGDLGHARHGRQPVAQIPVLEAAKLRERVTAALVDQGVLEHPPDAGGVGADRPG